MDAVPAVAHAGARPPDKSTGTSSIWWFAFGYFAAYAPYGAITKALTSGELAASERLDGLSLLPLSIATSVVCMFTLLKVLGWFRYAHRTRIVGLDLPTPTRWTLLSGLATAAVVLTTTLAYTFANTSIVFMMLLMRGGVLAIAPVADFVGGRAVRWFSWVALALSALAMAAAGFAVDTYELTLWAVVDIAVYLGAYFLRLRFMSKLAKGGVEDNRRFFVEEQMVATPAAVLGLAVFALVLPGAGGDSIRRGFLEVPFGGAALWVGLVGFLSQLTGVFGGLVLLDPRENTYCVPVNRASSVLAGVVASYALLFAGAAPAPELAELVGASFLVSAILVLSFGPMFTKKR